MEQENLAYALSVGAAAALLAGAVHWSLDRLAKRLPRWRSGRLCRSLGIPQVEDGEHLMALLVAPLKVGLWMATALFAADQIAALRLGRAMFVQMAERALMGPLFEIEGHAYSVSDVIELPLVVTVVWLAAAGLAHLLRTKVLTYTGMNRGVQETIVLLARYLGGSIASLIVLHAWGVDVRSLALALSVLGVGIGFGLQNIANNFVSGLVINFERPIQAGDFVRIGDLHGTVERIGGRCTHIRTLDQVTMLVPNSRLLENEVINWTHGDPVSRLHVPVGVAYGSDLRVVRTTLLDVARRHPEVLRDPRPRVELRHLGDSALRFELLVWTAEPRSQFRLISDLNFQIVLALRRAAIQIPFPQRELHLRSPKIETLLTAWGRHHLGVDGFDEPEAPLTSSLSVDDVEERGPASWSDERVDAVVTRMRGPSGIAVIDRRHLLKIYPRCFVGREAIDWLMQHEDLTRSEAIDFGEQLIRRGVIHHVLDEHGFKDGSFFYRFLVDEETSHAA